MELTEWAIVGILAALLCMGLSGDLARGIHEGVGRFRKLLYWFRP